jgi:hypothetical protein
MRKQGTRTPAKSYPAVKKARYDTSQDRVVGLADVLWLCRDATPDLKGRPEGWPLGVEARRLRFRGRGPTSMAALPVAPSEGLPGEAASANSLV